MRYVPHLRFPEFSGEWEKVRLGDNCNIQMCKRIMADQTNTEGGVPFYKIGTIGGKADSYISKELFDEYKLKYSFPNKGDVMITCAGTVGKCIIYNGEDSYYQDSNIVWIDNPNEVTSNDFLYLLLCKVNWSHLNSTTIVRIYNDDLRNLKLFSPQLDEQKKITHFFSLINERIATQNKIIEDLKKLKCAIIEKHYRQTELYKHKVCDLGKPFSVGNLSKEDLSDEGHECVLYGELFTTYDCVINEVKSHTNKIANMTLSQKGDLLFPSSTTVDAISLISPSVIDIPNVVLGGDMFGIHTDKNCNAYYLSYYINIIARKRLAIYAKGSTIIHLHYNDIANAQLLLPDLCEQDRIAKCMMAEDDKIQIEELILTQLEKQKLHLLRQMFI